jgi:hypothetical protein
MADPQRRADVLEIAALAAATDREGRVDPMAYEAQRLILQSQRLGSIDADALVRDLQRSPGFEQFDRDAFLKAIDTRLDSPAEKKRFAEALDTANITDGFVERKLEQAGEVVSDAYGYVKGKAAWADDYLTKQMSWSYQRAGEIENDPNATELQRRSAGMARDVVGKAQELYGQSSGGIVHSLNTLKGFVDLGEMGYRFTTDENYRDLLIATAKLYAAQTMDDPSKPVRDLRNAATQALESWEQEYKQAKAEGRERQFLGETEGAIGVELAATLIPVSKLGKFGKVANALDAGTPDALDEVAELTGDANRALRRAEGDAPTAHPGETVAEASARSARAAEAAEDVLRAEIRLFRDEGKLDQLIDAAHRTGNVEGLLRSGELNPKELAEVLKRDATVFDGKVSYLDAVNISTQGVDLSKLTTKQLGDIGEALHTYDLVKAGHTDIVSIKNASGHGIDVVSRDPTGKLQFDEVKASATGQAKGQHGDPEHFIPDRLERAIAQRGHWADHNTLPGLDGVARDLRREIMDPDTDKLLPGLNAKWVQMNLSRSPGSTKLDVDKTVEDWVKPETKKQSLLESFNLEDQTIHQRVFGKAKEKGLDDERADNLAAQGLLAFKQDRLTRSADDVGIYGDRLFITHFPHGFGRDPNHHVNLEVAAASQKPAQETLQQVAQLDQQQAQERLAQQQTQQQSGPDGPKGPTIGPRIA